MTASPAPITSERAGNPLAWAVYLGISWTWCIGMFLPVLLVRDYGIWGWVVFAVPNVVGAAAMGWVLHRPGSSERIVAEHRTACVAFSAITLAFHAFFLAWMATFVIPWPVCLTVVVVATILSQLKRPRSALEISLAVGVLGTSLAVLGRLLLSGDFTLAHGRHSRFDLIGLTPVCLLGFALCPYLDLTFHRARQATNRAGARQAFGIGFGVVFLTMIVLTLLYVKDFVSLDSPLVHNWIAIHLCAQIGFTWMAHLRTAPKPRDRELPIWIAAGLLAVIAGAVVWQPEFLMFKQKHGPEMLTGELIYRLFMAFYGLVFPAYVWICMTPVRGRSAGVSRRSLAVLTVAILVACPMFWLGFVVCRTPWLIVGVAVVVLAKGVAGQSARVEIE